MEPGHEDREYWLSGEKGGTETGMPQWSPVMKTGNTEPGTEETRKTADASMEPGHEDREYGQVH